MPLDKIVVIIMAIMFFGGLAYIIWKGQQQDKSQGSASPAAAPDAAEESGLNKPQEKKRRGSRK